MGIIKKFDSKSIKIRWATENLLQNPDSPLFCDKCHNRLGIFYMLRCSLFKKKDASYLVICRNCHYINQRVKGKINKDIDRIWDEYGV